MSLSQGKATGMSESALFDIALEQEGSAGRVRAVDESRIPCPRAARPRISVLRLPPRRTSPAARRPYRVADLPVTLTAVPLIIPLAITTCQGIGDILPAITKPHTRFQRSKQRLIWKEPSGKRERRDEAGQFLSMQTPSCRSNQDKGCHSEGELRLS